MSKILMLAVILLCSTAWLEAQDQYPQSGQTGSSQSATSASGGTAVEGCLQGSNGNFTLTDSSGKTYQLQGDTSKLTKHVGHEVEITGSTSGTSAASSSSGMAQGGSQPQALTVDKVKHISESCKSSK